MSTRRLLLNLMTDGQFYSGESLGQHLGLSRAAVWKQIQALQSEGLQFESAHAKGYRLLTPVELLDVEVIASHLPEDIRNHFNLEVFDELDSSNRYLMQNSLESNSNRVPVCFAEKQTAGRGRRGRVWQTPYATALAMSLRWRFEADASCLAGLSLATGVAVAKSLEQAGVLGVQLKWPNDLLCADAKLGGILIELAGDASGPCHVVIGIGLNITTSAIVGYMENLDIEQAWTDIRSHSSGDETVSRNKIAAGLIQSLFEMLQLFEKKGFAAFINDFNQRDALCGRSVFVQQVNQNFVGTACGVNESGSLLLQCDDDLKTITSGDVSVRAIVAS